MPKIDVSVKDLELLSNLKFSSKEKLENALEFVKGEIDALDGDLLKVDCKDPNRPDLWSAEGLARELKARVGKESGPVKYKVQKSKVKVFIDGNLGKIRPLISCAVIKDIEVTETLLIQMIQLQEKLGESFGRKRKELGIGLYDLDIMEPPIYYKGFKDNDVEFVPLEWKVPLRPSEILQQHEKGKTYAHLLTGSPLYPIVVDHAGTIASMPPIINSAVTGKVTEKTKNLFIEVTGFKWEIVESALEIMCMALADRGGKIHSCTLNFPSGKKPYPAKKISTPCFLTKKTSFDKSLIERKTGLVLKDEKIIDLLKRARYNASIKGKKVFVEYGAYRTDILHAVDVIEDLLISYGFNNIVPQKIEMNVVGSQRKESLYNEFVRDGCIGLALQEIQTYNLSSKEIQATNMFLGDEKDDFVEIANFVSLNYQILRKRLAPQVLSFLAKNKSQEYPQRVFEIGTVLSLDSKDPSGAKQSTNLCIASTHSNAGFTEIKSILVSLSKYLGKELVVKKKPFPFLGDNSAEILIDGKKGFIGEVKKEVLDNFGLNKPVIILEFEL